MSRCGLSLRRSRDIRDSLNLSDEIESRPETLHTVVVQIAGKKRGTLQVPSTMIENQTHALSKS